MDTTIDILQIKIEEAKARLSEESRDAIEAVPWKMAILAMRAEKGYSFSQLEDLEIETELLLYGILNPEDYPKELEKRMGIPKDQVDVLVNEMNEKVFKKIREEFVKNIERKKTFENRKKEAEIQHPPESVIAPEDILEKLETREELLKKIENPEPVKKKENYEINDKELPAPEELKEITNDESRIEKEEKKENPHPILANKLSGPFQIPPAESDHSLSNITKSAEEEKNKPPRIDPYRMPIE